MHQLVLRKSLTLELPRLEKIHFYYFSNIIIAGPDLEFALSGHSMVSVDLGQAIIGGTSNEQYHKTIYYLDCSNVDMMNVKDSCKISSFGLELSMARSFFVAIPLPQHLFGSVSEGIGSFTTILNH